MSCNIVLPPPLKLVIKQLEACGFEAYAVGGFVRDCLLERKCYDYDVTTSAKPDEIIACFSDYAVIETGLKHGTVTVVVEHNNIEITTYRIDGEYQDNRHPDKVLFTTSLADDLMRRDFTINALAYNDRCGLIDLYGGVDDLTSCTISAIGDANTRFKEDALRILRAFRFAAQLGFSIDSKTKVAISEQVDLLGNISSERITSEFIKTLSSPNPLAVLREMDRLGALKKVLSDYTIPEKLCDKPIFTVRLAQLIENVDATSRLRFDSKTAYELGVLLSYKHKTIECERVLFKKYMRDVGIELFGRILDLCCYGTSEAYELYENIIACGECVNIGMLDIKGNDLIGLGFSGVEVGKTLSQLLLMVIENRCSNDKQQLIDIARELKALNK